MSELSFLIDLLLNQKLSKPVKELIAARIREIEARPQPTVKHPGLGVPIPAHLSQQSPSTIANLLKEDSGTLPQPIAVTAQASQALEQRNAAIRAARAGPFDAKPDPGRTSPRKF